MREVGTMAAAVTRPSQDPLCLPAPRSGDTPTRVIHGVYRELPLAAR
jgi:hypothetical protein